MKKNKKNKKLESNKYNEKVLLDLLSNFIEGIKIMRLKNEKLKNNNILNERI